MLNEFSREAKIVIRDDYFLQTPTVDTFITFKKTVPREVELESSDVIAFSGILQGYPTQSACMRHHQSFEFITYKGNFSHKG